MIASFDVLVGIHSSLLCLVHIVCPFKIGIILLNFECFKYKSYVRYFLSNPYLYYKDLVPLLVETKHLLNAQGRSYDLGVILLGSWPC